ncbi:hypothetical protein [Segniliparus rugosus]|uniref:DUF4878 domain-containing protein n=1 Tax=Segniliparus rugosus (strain ATCC BAA-974 / DSM 45345 / CCUG 50838 / CIP 108380 / JCM 13579 / CDC 945) TaxID=679197 RepID=E5XTR5_SEGRC|nr:hypothetical protein [Segniliparus rugosus]EFV12268.1 hypothetical protein HMPREF9336_02887 [Segniliparus rugosus ATCC BAA-974]
MTFLQQPGFPQPWQGGHAPKKSKKTLWIVLSIVGALLICAGGFAVFIWKMTLSPDSGPQQIKALAKEYKAAEDAGDTAKLASLLCSADVPDAGSILRADAKVAPGEIDVQSTSTVNDLGSVGFRDSKGTRWRLYFRKEDGMWKACPSAEDAYRAADKE